MIGDEALDPLPGLDGVLLHLLRYLPGGKWRAPITVVGNRDARQNPTPGTRHGFPGATFAADPAGRTNHLNQYHAFHRSLKSARWRLTASNGCRHAGGDGLPGHQ